MATIPRLETSGLEPVSIMEETAMGIVAHSSIQYNGYFSLLIIGTRRGEWLFRLYNYIVPAHVSGGNIVAVDNIHWDGRPFNYQEGRDLLTPREAEENGRYVTSIIHNYNLQNITLHTKGSTDYFANHNDTFDCVILNGARGYSEFSSDLTSAYAVLNDKGTIAVPFYGKTINGLRTDNNLTKAVDEFSDKTCRKRRVRCATGMMLMRKFTEKTRKLNGPGGKIDYNCNLPG
jgi:hypothetical protein